MLSLSFHSKQLLWLNEMNYYLLIFGVIACIWEFGSTAAILILIMLLAHKIGRVLCRFSTAHSFNALTLMT